MQSMLVRCNQVYKNGVLTSVKAKYQCARLFRGGHVCWCGGYLLGKQVEALPLYARPSDERSWLKVRVEARLYGAESAGGA